MEILVLLIAGLIIGLLGKFIAPGDKDNIPIWLTLLCGIGGVLLGWFIYDAVAGDEGGDSQWIGWLVSIAVATVLVIAASTITGKNTSRTRV